MNDIDYMSTILDRSFPLGEHIEIFNFKALEIAYQNAVTIDEREHVTPYIYNKMKKKCLPFSGNFKDSKLENVRLCIDYHEDLELVNHIIDYFHPRINFKTAEIIDFLSEHSHLKKINSSFMKPLKINL